MANYTFVDADQLDADLESIAESIRAKSGTSEKLAFPQEMKSAIDAISTGVIAQVATGTVRVSGTATSVTCRDPVTQQTFKPDVVLFTSTNPNYSNEPVHAGVSFTEAGVTSIHTIFVPPSSDYIMSYFTVTQMSTGFQISGRKISSSSMPNESNRSVSYIAIKYTA